MLSHNYRYDAILADSLKVNWRVEDLIGGDKKLDFSRPFLPDSLAGADGISCLSGAGELQLKQIPATSYLYLFALTEEFIIPFSLDAAGKVGHRNARAT